MACSFFYNLFSACRVQNQNDHQLNMVINYRIVAHTTWWLHDSNSKPLAQKSEDWGDGQLLKIIVMCMDGELNSIFRTHVNSEVRCCMPVISLLGMWEQADTSRYGLLA